MVPGVETRLTDGDQDEVIHVADMVSAMVIFNVCSFVETTPLASERRFKRSIRRYEES